MEATAVAGLEGLVVAPRHGLAVLQQLKRAWSEALPVAGSVLAPERTETTCRASEAFEGVAEARPEAKRANGQGGVGILGSAGAPGSSG